MNSESVNGESRSGRVVGCSLRCASPALILALGRRWDGADGQVLTRQDKTRQDLLDLAILGMGLMAKMASPVPDQSR